MNERSRKTAEHFDDQETKRRAEAALRAAFSMPPKPQSEMKLGKRKGKSGGSPQSKSRSTDRTR